MAKNDRLLLDGIIDDRIALAIPSGKRDEAFEYLVCEQILKEFDLASDELRSGVTDGRRDGGIDGFFIIVNGHLLQDPEAFVWPRAGSELRVIVITSKHHDTFKQATLDALVATLTEIFDLSIDEKDLQGAYSESLLRMRQNLKFAYRKLSPRLTSFSIAVYYASRGDTSEVGSEVRARAAQIAALIAESFGSCQASFAFLGATELVELHRKIPNYTLELSFVEALAKGERYVVLVRLREYYKFVSDEGRLRRYLFESNVRDFMGLNRVNEDILATLGNPSSPDFWWLNNGVTILATSAAITGKSIQIADVQIVNGLQTTEAIFRHFRQPFADDDRCLLVKVIVTREDAIRDAIIRATNNQTVVELASLHATDKIQRDIEDVLKRHGLFYERRKNHYANQGHASADLVAPLYAAAGYVALILKSPHDAASLRSKFMRSPDLYALVFSGDVSLEVWPRIVQLLKRVDATLETLRPTHRSTDRFLKGWRYMIALLLAAETFGTFDFTPGEFAVYDAGQVSTEQIKRLWLDLNQLTTSDGIVGGPWTSRARVRDACRKMGEKLGVTDAAAVGANRQWSQRSAGTITDNFVEEVREVLPPQPWKPGLHRVVAKQLNCHVGDYFAAVERLIADGVVYRQKDGVLYDRDGNVVAFDPERVDPDSLELLVPIAGRKSAG